MNLENYTIKIFCNCHFFCKESEKTHKSSAYPLTQKNITLILELCPSCKVSQARIAKKTPVSLTFVKTPSTLLFSEQFEKYFADLQRPSI
jgi:hypothetical protein